MALVHEMEATGNWLFKRRSWLPVILIIAGIIVMYLANRQAILFDMRDELIFLGVSIAGEIIRILTVGYAPRGTSGRNTSEGQVAEELNVTGIYSVVRHPLYIGNFFMWLGPVLFLRNAGFDLVFLLVYWLYYERIIFAEEQFLRRKFGDVYDKWSETVGPVIPTFRYFRKPSIAFSFRNVVKREYHTFINIFLIFAILDLFRNYFLAQRIYITSMWLWITIPAALVWVAVRIISKRTKWLEVEGR